MYGNHRHYICILLIEFSFILCLYVYELAHMCMYHVCAWCLKKSEEAIRSHKIEVMDGYEGPCGFCKMNPGPVQVLLSTELSFWSLYLLYFIFACYQKCSLKQTIGL